MEQKVNKKNEDQLRSLFSETKDHASENLKYRIMQQIQTEAALSRKITENKGSVFSAILPVLGIMYLIVAVILLIVYLVYGSEALYSSTVYVPVLSVASVCSIYLLISAFDEKRRIELKSKKSKEKL